jgi:hypothetical protein
MAFHTAEYETFVLLGDPSVPPPWDWAVWRRLVPALDPLIRAARGKPAVRSTQYAPDRKGTVKFGRLGWKDADHQKWTHDSPTTGAEARSWGFVDVEVWAPAWTTYEREDRAPDVFLTVANEALGSGFRQGLLFSPVIVLAVVAELARREPAALAAAVAALRELSAAKLVGHRRRPWGRPFGSVGFTGSIQDLAVSGLFKPGKRHQGELGFHVFAEKWEPVT